MSEDEPLLEGQRVFNGPKFLHDYLDEWFGEAATEP